MMNLSKNDTVIDIGCGTGIDVYEMSKIVEEKGRVIGLDNDHKMIEEARNSYNEPNLEFTKGNVRKIPFPDEYFRRSHG